MHTVSISDVTLKQKSADTLSFREKVELVRILDRMRADVIEIGRIEQVKADSLFIKTVSDAVEYSTVAAETLCDEDSILMTWQALKNAKKPRLQIAAPVSLVQMEYLYHKKPEAVKELAAKGIRFAKTLCPQAEFIARDAMRAEPKFLYEILEAVIEAGADTVTVCDTAGESLPEESAAFIRGIRENVPSIGKAVLGFMCADDLTLADACSISAMKEGCGEVKASIFAENCASIRSLAAVIAKKGSQMELCLNIRTVELKRLYEQASRMFTDTRSKNTPFENGVRENEGSRLFTASDDIGALISETRRLGYDLNEEDQVRVYEEFRQIAARKENVTSTELEAIVASSALQVPSTYQMEDYIINACSKFTASAHIRLLKKGEPVESVALGDGPVDASFLALEQIAGRHYELDDFKIRAVTEGREAMGEAVVRLRNGGKVYSGRGLSTDIIGSSISAYINALNKIVYEEENE